MTFAAAVKTAHFAVRFSWGGSSLPNPDVFNIDDEPSVLRLTDNDDGLSHNGEDYVPAVFELRLGKTTGGLDESETTIELPLGVMPDELSSGPHARVEVIIYEIVVSEAGTETACVFRGEIHTTARNPEDHDGSEILKCFSAKKVLSMGQSCIPADDHCVWHLFGPGCRTVNTDNSTPNSPENPSTYGPTIEDMIQAATLSAASGQDVTISSILDSSSVAPGRVWEDGYLEHRGLRIKIIEWDETTQVSIGGGNVSTTMRLAKKPPASWIGQVVRAIPGCSKAIEKCRATYDNERNFCGSGYGSLSYNPLLGSPS